MTEVDKWGLSDKDWAQINGGRPKVSQKNGLTTVRHPNGKVVTSHNGIDQYGYVTKEVGGDLSKSRWLYFGNIMALLARGKVLDLAETDIIVDKMEIAKYSTGEIETIDPRADRQEKPAEIRKKWKELAGITDLRNLQVVKTLKEREKKQIELKK